MAAKVALVTGASSGIGQATARLLAKQGYIVFGTSRKPQQNQSDGFTLLPLDVTSDESVRQCVDTVLRQAKRIDLLVSNAGYNQVGAIEENSIADAQAQFDTNVFGTMRVINAVLPAMRQQGGGRIVVVSSLVGLTAVPYAGVYSASKFALEGLSEALRSEVAQFNIQVSLIEPGTIKTNLTGRAPAHPIGIYETGRQSVLGFLREGVENGPDPVLVAQQIVKIAETPKPRLHNVLGGRPRLLTVLKRVLPEPAFERVRSRVFRIPSGQPQPSKLQVAPR